MTDQPIACTLGPGQIEGGVAPIAALAADALLASETIDGGLRARFRDEPGIEQRVRDLAAAESQCCAFLRFDVHSDRRDIVLDITGSPEAQPAIEQIFPALHA